MGKVRGVKNGDVLSSTFDGRTRRKFKNIGETKVLLLVSIIGNEYCAGEYLSASIATAVSQHKETTVLIADEVYWNNLKNEELPSDEVTQELKAEARVLGEKFLSENLGHILTGLSLDVAAFERQYAELTLDEKISKINDLALEQEKHFSLQRWSDWLKGTKMNPEEMSNFMGSNPEMQASIEKTAQDFSSRHKGEASEELWLMRSRSYLKEETPAVMWVSAERGYHFVAYPGNMISPFEAARKYFVGQGNADEIESELRISSDDLLINWLDINFRRSQSKQQLLQQSLINAPSLNSSQSAASSSASTHSHAFFSGNHDFSGSDDELMVVEMARKILSAPGSQQFKINVLLDAVAALGNSEQMASNQQIAARH